MKIAIVGSGIAGLASAYLLAKGHEVTVFEANDYIGGHTHTVTVDDEGAPLHIDTGFIVFNEWTYPNFIRLLEKLGVDSKPSRMGFSVCCETDGIEYSGDSLSGLFAQRANLLNPSHYRMIWDILRFFRKGKRFIETGDEHLSIGRFMDSGDYSKAFADKFLVPMMSAIWSAGPDTIRRLPAAHFLRFFKNHGLLNVVNRPTWRVVEGGSFRYVEKIQAFLGDRIRLNTPIQRVTRSDKAVHLHYGDERKERFDEVILAVHSDQALRMLAEPTAEERAVLGAIAYQENEVVLHTDESLLPQEHSAWTSWNYRLLADDQDRAVLTYNMNILQGLDSNKTYCVTLNHTDAIDQDKIQGRYTYHHPLYTSDVIDAQRDWSVINGRNRTHFCGAYWGYGFHEDGVNSALAVCERFNVGFE
jgi:predicted NAD/FAD-binding protein